MNTISDLKLAYWENATSKTGTLADLEMAFLEGAISKTGTLDDLRSIYFGTDGPLPFFQRLTGGEGTLADLEYQFYSNFDPDTAELLNTPGLESIWLSSDVNGVGANLPNDGDAIGLWKDLSSKKRDLSQATMANRPLWRKAGVNLLTANQATAVDAAFSYSFISGHSTVTPTVALPGATTVMQYTASADHAAAKFTVPVTPGQTYARSVWVLGPTTSRTVYLQLLYFDASNKLLSTVNGTPTATLSATWVKIATSDVAPVNAASMQIVALVADSAAGEQFQWGKFQLELGSTATPWLPPGNAQGMQFDGVNDFLQTVALTGWPETTVYAVGNALKVSSPIFLHYGSSRVRGLQLIRHPSNTWKMYWGNGTVEQSGGAAVGDQNTHVFSALAEPTRMRLFTDGLNGLDSSTTFAPAPAAPLLVGTNGGTAPLYHLGLIHDILICSQAHDDATRQKVEAILMKRNGITP